VIRGPRSHRCRNAFSRSTRIASHHSRLTMPIVQGPSSVVTWSSEIMRPMRCLAHGASVCRMCESCLGTHVPHYGDLPLIPVRRTCRVSPLSQRRSPSDKPEMRFRTNVPRYSRFTFHVFRLSALRFPDSPILRFRLFPCPSVPQNEQVNVGNNVPLYIITDAFAAPFRCLHENSPFAITTVRLTSRSVAITDAFLECYGDR